MSVVSAVEGTSVYYVVAKKVWSCPTCGMVMDGGYTKQCDPVGFLIKQEANTACTGDQIVVSYTEFNGCNYACTP